MTYASLARVMIAAPTSGAGKTTITCALLAALQREGLRVQAFKSGSDAIDPMFHREVVGTKSGNLDLFLMGKDACVQSLAESAAHVDIAVLEGAMGYYDGIANTDTASAYALSVATRTPVVLVLDARKVSLSLAATLKGFAAFREHANICGVILNFASASLHALLAPALFRETGIPVLGHMPTMAECALESRELGLIPAAEIENLREQIAMLAEQMRQTVDLQALLAIARDAPAIAMQEDKPTHRKRAVRIAVAQDAAFCFAYPQALRALERMGAKLLPFSPLSDHVLPQGAQGLYIPGGYPELYAKQLSESSEMRASIYAALAAGLPTIAEAGGFVYLHQTIEGAGGGSYPMVGHVSGHARRTQKLSHFGYAKLTAQHDTLLLEKEHAVHAHVFHYWQSDAPGDALLAEKPLRDAAWRCGVCTDTLFAGLFQMLIAGTSTMERFLSKCEEGCM